MTVAGWVMSFKVELTGKGRRSNVRAAGWSTYMMGEAYRNRGQVKTEDAVLGVHLGHPGNTIPVVRPV